VKCFYDLHCNSVKVFMNKGKKSKTDKQDKQAFGPFKECNDANTLRLSRNHVTACQFLNGSGMRFPASVFKVLKDPEHEPVLLLKMQENCFDLFLCFYVYLKIGFCT